MSDPQPKRPRGRPRKVVETMPAVAPVVAVEAPARAPDPILPPVPATGFLAPLQREAWARDAWDAYQSQDEIKRTDALNRVWTFRYEIVANHAHILIEARRGQAVSRQLVLSSQMTMESALEAVDAADRETA